MLKTASKISYLPFFIFCTKIWCICRSVLWMNHSPSIGSIPLTSSLYILLTISSLIHWLSNTVIWTMRFHSEMHLSSLLFESLNWLLLWHLSYTWSCVPRFRNHTIALHAHNCVCIHRLLPNICPILCRISQMLHSSPSDSLHCVTYKKSTKRMHSTFSVAGFAILPIQGSLHLWYPISFHETLRSRKYPRSLQRCLSATYRVHTWPVPSFRLPLHLFYVSGWPEVWTSRHDLLELRSRLHLERSLTSWFHNHFCDSRFLWTFVIWIITKMMIHFAFEHCVKHWSEQIFESVIHVLSCFWLINFQDSFRQSSFFRVSFLPLRS